MRLRGCLIKGRLVRVLVGVGEWGGKGGRQVGREDEGWLGAGGGWGGDGVLE